MKKLWNDWSGPVAFTLGWTLLLAAALLMPNVPVWADEGGGGLPAPKKCKDTCSGSCFLNGQASGCNTDTEDWCQRQPQQADCKDCKCTFIDDDDPTKRKCECKPPKAESPIP